MTDKMRVYHVELIHDLRSLFPIEVSGVLTNTVPKGKYVTRENTDGNFIITEGPYKNICLQGNNCRVVERRDYEVGYVNELELKLSQAGQELAELRKQNPDRSRYRYEQKDKFISEVDEVLEGICKQYNLDVGGIRNMIGRMERLLHRQAEEIATLKEKNKDAETSMVNAKHTLSHITEVLTHIDKEQGGFEVNPEYPIGSMDTIRAVLQSWRREIKEVRKERDNLLKEGIGLELSIQAWNEYDQNINQNLTDFLSSLGYSIEGQDTQGKSEMLREVYEDMKTPIPSEGPIHRIVDDMLIRMGKIVLDSTLHEKVVILSENLNRKVLVPSEVAKALDTLHNHFQDDDMVYASIMQQYYEPGDFQYDWITDAVNVVSKWRYPDDESDNHIGEFNRLMNYGYVADRTDREKKIEFVVEIIERNGVRDAADLIHQLYEGDGSDAD